MGKNEHPYRRHLFMVRLWRDESGRGLLEWRGQVQCASDGEKRAFQDWPDLIEFLKTKLHEIPDDDEV